MAKDKQRIIKKLRQKALSPSGKRKLKSEQEKADETIKNIRESGRVDPEMLKQVFTI